MPAAPFAMLYLTMVFFETAMAADTGEYGDLRLIVAFDYLRLLRAIERGERVTSVPDFARARLETVSKSPKVSEADFAVDSNERTFVLSANDRFSDIANPHGLAVEICDDERVVLFRCAQLPWSSHTELLIDALDTTRWNVDVAVPQSVGDIRYDETARGEPVVVDPDPNRQPALPCYIQLRDAR